LVPGQILSREIANHIRRLHVREIHGYEPELGLRVFTAKALGAATAKGDE
jgi:arginine decarboxylase